MLKFNAVLLEDEANCRCLGILSILKKLVNEMCIVRIEVREKAPDAVFKAVFAIRIPPISSVSVVVLRDSLCPLDPLDIQYPIRHGFGDNIRSLDRRIQIPATSIVVRLGGIDLRLTHSSDIAVAGGSVLIS